MLLRIENSFLQLANKLGKPFSEEDKERLAISLELNYHNIRSVISTQENSKEQLKQVNALGRYINFKKIN